jgi:hypothetical protein
VAILPPTRRRGHGKRPHQKDSATIRMVRIIFLRMFAPTAPLVVFIIYILFLRLQTALRCLRRSWPTQGL